MRPKIIIICTIILMFCVWLLLHYRTSPLKGEAASTITSQPLPNQSTQVRPAQSQVPKPFSAPQIKTPRPLLTTNEIRERILADWQKPIDFYGKVIDEDSNPVTEVHISFQWAGFEDQVSSATTESDANGLFSLQGKTGQNVHISISKDGYYTSRKDIFDFQYSLGPDIYMPNEWNPVIFHLHKKGTPEPLIRLAGAVLGPRQYRLDTRGAPTDISFYTGKRTSQGEGQLRVQYWMDIPQDANRRQFDWRCLVTVPGGGLQVTTEEFPFGAPQEGYQESIQMQSDTNAWTYMPEESFYMRLPDGKYGRMKFTLNCGGNPFFGIEALINPSGSTNLEYVKYLPGNIMVDQSAP
jgi:hypothetical protein